MRKIRQISLLLAFTVFTVQASGVHVHALQSSDVANFHETTVVHLALATDHTGDQGTHHDRDTELSLPDRGILKKAGGDNDLVGLPALRHVLSAPALLHDHLTATNCHIPDPRAHAFARPLLRAPPAFQIV